jgi:predicted membrane protein
MIAGHLKVDLSRIDVGSSTVTVNASLVAGRMEVVVPEGTNVVVTGTLAAGSADLFGTNRDGSDVSLATLDPGQAGTGTIRLDLGMTYGYVKIDRPATTLGFRAGSKAAPKPFRAPNAPLVSKNLVSVPLPPAPPGAPIG